MRTLLILVFGILVIILAAYRNPVFFREMFSRDGTISSKKFWYSAAALTATICLLWVTYKDNMDDWIYVCLFCIYLVTVGGFEVMLKMMAMVIEFKTGKPATSSTTTTTSTSTEVKGATDTPPQN